MTYQSSLIEEEKFVKLNPKDNKINSEMFFYDVLYKDGASCSAKITDTVIFEQSGNKANMVKFWLFNSKKGIKGSNLKILRKNKENVASLDSMFKLFTGEYQDNIIYSDLDKNLYKELKNEYMIRFSNSDCFLVNIYELKWFLNERQSDVVFLQKKIQMKETSNVQQSQFKDLQFTGKLTNETFVVQYSRKSKSTAPKFKLLKQSIRYDEMVAFLKSKTRRAKNLEETAKWMKKSYFSALREFYNLTPLSEEITFINPVDRKYSGKGLLKEVFQMRSAEILERLIPQSNSIIHFFETKWQLSLSNISLKFVFGADSAPYFLGGFQCYGRITNDALLRIVRSTSESIETRDIDEALENHKHDILSSTHGNLRRNHTSMPQLQGVSKKLMGTIIPDVCGGDFCSYEIFSNYKDNYLLIDPEIKAKAIPYKNRLLENTTGPILKHMIMHNLIHKTRKYAEIAVRVLKRFSFVPSQSHLRIENLVVENIPDKDYKLPLASKLVLKKTFNSRGRVEYVEEHVDLDLIRKSDFKYKSVKVCPKCYMIYKLLHEQYSEFDSNLLRRPKRNNLSLKLKSGFQSPNASKPIIHEDMTQSSAKIVDINVARKKNKILMMLDHIQEEEKKQKKDFRLHASNKKKDSKMLLLDQKYRSDRLVLGMQLDPSKLEATPKMRGDSQDRKPGDTSKEVEVIRVPHINGGMSIKVLHLSKVDCFNRVRNKRDKIFKQRDAQQKIEQAILANKIKNSKRRNSIDSLLEQDEEDDFQEEEKSPRNQRKKTKVNLNMTNFKSRNFSKISLTSLKEAEDDDNPARVSKEDIFKQRVDKRRKATMLYLEQAKADKTCRVTYVDTSKPSARELEFYQYSVPKLLPNYDKCYYKKFKGKVFSTFGDVVEEIGMEDFIPIEYERDILLYIHDSDHAIPYIILQAKEVDDDMAENIIVVNDIFDNFVENIEFYKAIITRLHNKRIILFNYPGQAFTTYIHDFEYTNKYLSEVLDGFLFHLEQNRSFDLERNTFKFIGYGYGGNILLYFLAANDRLFNSFRHVLLFNTFTFVDKSLRQFFSEYKDELEGDGIEDPEYTFYFYNYIVSGSDQTQKKEYFRSNPITLEGRKSLIQGVLSSVDLHQIVQNITLPIYVVQSLTNCLVDITHCDKLLSVNMDYQKGIRNSDNDPKRKPIYIEGGHNVFVENPKKLKDLITKLCRKK